MSRVVLSTEDLTKQFGGHSALDQISLGITEGDITAVIGPNGAGKTTLFDLLVGRLEPTSGTVTFRGKRIDGQPTHEIARSGIARSFQITNFFPELTVAENARLAAQRRHTGFRPADFLSHYSSLETVEAEAQRTLDAVGLSDVASEVASTLSHGQRRHLEIGIALALDPDVLLMDEPTAGMSPEETTEMTGLIGRIARDTTLVIVEHDMDVVMNVSDRIAVINQGELLTVDEPAVVRQDERVQSAYFGGGTM